MTMCGSHFPRILAHMNVNKSHEAPLVPKLPVSLVVLEGADMEAVALRAALEYFNCQVDTHWIGSKKECCEILRGNISTHSILVLCCHGDETGILCGGEASITPTDVAECAAVGGKSVVVLGCNTGNESFADAFLHGGADAYIAPAGYPEGDAALLFGIHLFYAIQQHGKSVREAQASACAFDDESAMFKLWSR